MKEYLIQTHCPECMTETVANVTTYRQKLAAALGREPELLDLPTGEKMLVHFNWNNKTPIVGSSEEEVFEKALQVFTSL
jgi:hypothetical protein